jgi:hypothetical protein
MSHATAFVASTFNLPTTFHFLNNFTSQVYCTVLPKYGPCGLLDAAGSPHEIFNISIFSFFFYSTYVKKTQIQQIKYSALYYVITHSYTTIMLSVLRDLYVQHTGHSLPKVQPVCPINKILLKIKFCTP